MTTKSTSPPGVPIQVPTQGGEVLGRDRRGCPEREERDRGVGSGEEQQGRREERAGLVL